MRKSTANLLDQLEDARPFTVGDFVRRTDTDDYEIYRVMREQYKIGTIEDASTEPRTLWGVGLCALGSGQSFYAQAHYYERTSPLKLLAEVSE